MTHSTSSISELVDYADGRLRGAGASRIESHLADCKECWTWLETYRLLASSLEHPSSQEIAAHAIAPDRLDRPSRINRTAENDPDGISAHLEHCVGCSREVDLTRRAVREGRGKAPASKPVFSSPRRRFAYGAIAAGTLVLLATGSWLVSSQTSKNSRLAVTQRTLSGSELVEANRELAVAGSRIAKGAEVTLRAGEVVTLGEGFSVESGASLVVELKSSSPVL